MQNRKRILALAALSIACGLGAAQAQQPAQVDAQTVRLADTTFAAWDVDRNNAVSQQEFRNGWAGMQRRLMADGMRAQFNRVDANKDGAIDASEYRNLVLIQRAGASAPALASFDDNKDRRLQFQEYLKLVERLTPKQ